MRVKSLPVFQPIATFDESIEAAKIVSRAIEDGLLDDAGEIAEITPQQFMLEDGRVIGVVVKILASAQMAGGQFACGRFVRELMPSSAAYPDAEPSRRVTRQGKEMIETTALIPAKAA